MHYDRDIRVSIVLCILAALFWFATAPVRSDEWTDLERIHNSGQPFTLIFSQKEARNWDRMFKDGRGHAIINGYWSKQRPSIGVAKWTFTGGRHDQDGWLIVNRQNGKITHHWYTEDPPKRSYRGWLGQGADSATTMIGLNMGFVEGNPLFGDLPGIGIAAVKLGITGLISRANVDICAPGMDALGTFGWAAGALNIGVMAGAGVYSILPAIVTGVYVATRGDAVWQCVPDDLFPLIVAKTK